ITYGKMKTLGAKSDPQIYLGCALAACRINDADRARTWAKNLPKLLMDQAVKVCVTYNINVKPAPWASASYFGSSFWRSLPARSRTVPLGWRRDASINAGTA